MEISGYFMSRGLFAIVFASIVILVIFSSVNAVPIGLTNAFASVAFVAIIYLIISLILGMSGLLNLIKKNYILFICMVLTIFLSIEVYNVITATLQGPAYFSLPFIRNFIINKLINFGVTMVITALTFGLSRPSD